jgi:hypothetical protein
MMKYKIVVCVTALLTGSTAVWAYGGGSSSSTKACSKPKFSDFKPLNNALVSPNAAFSFSASANTYPDSIKVSVKGEEVAVSITPKASGFEISGKLPKSVQNTYARIGISADGPNYCHGNGGWLVRVSD